MIKNTLIITILSAAIPLLAQDQQSQQNQQQSQQQSASSEKSQQDLKVSDQDMKHQVTDANKASKLIGMQVKNKQDEDLGKIKDVVIDFQSGKVAYAVLSSGGPFGGKLGIGGKMVAVPIQALTLQPGAKAIVVDLPKQQLSQAQGFSEQNWPDLNAAEKGQTVGLSSTAQGGTGSQSQQSSESKSTEQQDENKQ
ncbi:MAG TPA: PRC-barrel domain-containing protein [Verrucomicrobiae bacterium]|nr:PRC-barrel domain-containing protein [Verrucomicrobiae bacterium]